MSEKRINLLSALSWLALIIAAGVFSALLYKTSPYRLLRPYPFFGAAVAETESGNANGRGLIRVANWWKPLVAYLILLALLTILYRGLF